VSVSCSALLLPGLDGTGRLFEPMVEVQPEGWDVGVLSYDACGVDVDAYVASQLPADGRVVLVAESFSGPVAVRMAARHPDRVSHLVLAASFVRSPVPSWGRLLPWSALMVVRPPAQVLRSLLLGSDAGTGLTTKLRHAIASVPPAVMAGRIEAVLQVDVTRELASCGVPVLYLAATRDRVVGRRGLEQVLEVRPDATVAAVDAPHLVLQREPAWAWARIKAFVSGEAR